MRGIPSLITDIRKKVFTEVARMAYSGDYTDMEDIPFKIVPGQSPLHRESVFLERAIAGERVRLAMGLSLQPVQTRTLLTEGMDQAAIAEQYYEPPLVNIIPYACHACPTKQYRVTNFFIEIARDLFGAGFLEFQNIFLPVGISFFLFQSLSYTIDIYRGSLKPVDRWGDYLFYLSFFPQLVAGPIVRARDFLVQIRQNPIAVSREMFGTGIYLIAIGLFKKAVISDYISLNFVDRIFDDPALYSGMECLAAVYGYALQIYCDFSGYSDMAIGLALLLGFRFPKNFDAPYHSATITEFWRRWHISLSMWLRDYLYISLGGNRKGRLRTYFNLLVTMVLGGLWHGAAIRFVLWGTLHGVALALHKLWLSVVPGAKVSGYQMHPLSRLAGILVTFHLVCFGWLLFRADSMRTVQLMLHQITDNFHLQLLPQMLAGYGGVFALVGLGYLLHMLPGRADAAARRAVVASPFWVQVLLLASVAWGVMQIQSSSIQPFIYFQF